MSQLKIDVHEQGIYFEVDDGALSVSVVPEFGTVDDSAAIRFRLTNAGARVLLAWLQAEIQS